MLHFTPTSPSWLNLVEGWFAQLTNKRLRTGSFNIIDALTDAIDLWVDHWNDDPKPFIWTKTANDIVAKVKRGRAALAHQIESATDQYTDFVGQGLLASLTWLIDRSSHARHIRS